MILKEFGSVISQKCGTTHVTIFDFLIFTIRKPKIVFFMFPSLRLPEISLNLIISLDLIIHTELYLPLKFRSSFQKRIFSKWLLFKGYIYILYMYFS